MHIDIQAIIYDMDGVLINSEPLWRKAMIQSFEEIGIPFTDDDCRLTTGMRFIEVAKFWMHRFNRHDISVNEFNDLVLSRLENLIETEGAPMPGVMESLKYHREKGYKIALGTSSAHRLVDAVLNRLKIRDYFHVICSAEYMEYGKPHPQIFLECASQLEIMPGFCMVIEDSVNGIIAAKAAQMKAIAIPDEENLHNPKFAIADAIIPSLFHLIS